MSANLSLKMLQRVRRGIALLDKSGPPDWRERINPKTLDIALPFRCVLGHVYGDFDIGLDELKVPDAYEYGFYEYGMLADIFSYKMLNFTWAMELAA